MLDFPTAKNGFDVVCWFGRWYEQSGKGRLPDNYFKTKGAGFINKFKKEYTIEEIMMVVWGTCMTKPQTRSIWYCASFFDQLGKFYDLKEEYERKKKLDEEVEEVEYIEVENKQEDNEEDLFDEFL